ncbi:MAG: PAS domain S-box protein [Methylococcaceae bacterium]|nr:MAG: PAS domain S-box protein [Methylococcaceae bacterium]
MPANANASVTGNERTFIGTIISETDLAGNITMANDVFEKVSGYTQQELIGAPHNILRHPEMPRCVFKLLWATVPDKKSISAYVVNRAKNGDHYWVLATVTPKLDAAGNLVGYRSERAIPNRSVIKDVIQPLYASLLAEEKKYNNSDEGMESSFRMVLNLLQEKGVSYDQLIDSLPK